MVDLPGFENLDEQWADGLVDDAFKYAFLWATAMERQYRRLNEQGQGEVEALSDALLYLTCLRNTLRAAYLVDQVIGSGDDGYSIDWIRDFERRCPDVVAARNMLEHFDEYAIGGGRLQQGPGQAPLRVELAREDEARPSLTLRTTGSAMTINLRETTAAAGDLMVGLMMAHDQWEESVEEFHEWMRAVEARRKAGLPSIRTRPSQKLLDMFESGGQGS